MPLYNFCLVDQEKTDVSWPKECRDADQAMEHANHIATELAQDPAYRGLHITVTDEAGNEAGRVPVSGN